MIFLLRDELGDEQTRALANGQSVLVERSGGNSFTLTNYAY